MKVSLKKSQLVIYLLFIGTFFYPMLLRSSILPPRFSQINPFFLLAEVLIICKFANSKKKISIIFMAFLILIMSIIIICSEKGMSMAYIVKCLFIYSIPIVLIPYTYYWKFDQNLIKKLIKIMNIIVFIMVAVGLFNKIMGGIITERAKQFLNIADNFDRMWSIYGHPLYNAALILIYYSINYIANKYGVIKIKYTVLFFTTLLGLLLSASRSALVVFAILSLIHNYKRFNRMMLGVIIIALVYVFGGFNLIIERFSQSSLTNYRIETWEMVSTASYFHGFNAITGYGSNYLDTLKNYFAYVSMAFEFPLLAFFLYYGYVYTFLFYVFTLLIPIVILIRNKDYDILVCYVGVSAYMNTFNGITILSDICMQYLAFAFMCLALSKWKSGNL